LVMTHFRAYDPELGRWLSADPIGEDGGLNLYAYILGNSVNGWDPYGLFDPGWKYKIGGGILANRLANAMQMPHIRKDLDRAASENCISGNLLRGVTSVRL